MKSCSENIKVQENKQNNSADIKLLWKNPDGIEIDLNDPNAIQEELNTEKLRYRLKLQNRFLIETELCLAEDTSQQTCYKTLMQKLKDRAEHKGTSLAAELNLTIYKHMEAYKSKLKKIKAKLDVDNLTTKDTDKIWWHKTTAYDMSTKEGAKAYINRMTINHLGGSHTPARLANRLMQLRDEVIPKLNNNGYYEIAKWLDLYINDLLVILKQGCVPDALQRGRKRPELIKQVRNKHYDISDKYAFGTYLSFSYRDMLKQNPCLSEDEARVRLCNKVISELQKDPVNPTTTTAINILESIINSPTEFYNCIHAKRLASKRSAEKRKQKKKKRN